MIASFNELVSWWRKIDEKINYCNKTQKCEKQRMHSGIEEDNFFQTVGVLVKRKYVRKHFQKDIYKLSNYLTFLLKTIILNIYHGRDYWCITPSMKWDKD